MRVAFPRTAHVVNGPLSGGGVTRDDLIISKDEEALFFKPPYTPSTSTGATTSSSVWLVVEEKIDGANLGISLNAEGALQCQNRSHLVHSKSHTQFSTLDAFIAENATALCDLFHTLSAEMGGAPQDYILFGEWCAIVHSVYYDSLPESLVVFDLAKIVTVAPAGSSGKKGGSKSSGSTAETLEFFTTEMRNHHIDRCCPQLPIVPCVCEQQLLPPPPSSTAPLSGWDDLHKLWGGSDSTFSGSGSKMEGVVIRQECRTPSSSSSLSTTAGTAPATGVLLRRCKAVRDDFKAGIEDGGHWMSKELKKNIILHYDPRKV